MPDIRIAAALAAAAALALPGLAGAEGAGFKHEKSIYADDKDIALKHPEGVACDEQGAFVVADTGNGRIVTYAWKDGVLSGGKPVKLPQLVQPTRLQLDSKGVVLALDRKARKVVRIDAGGAYAGWVEPKGASAGKEITVVAFKVDADDGLALLDVSGGRVLLTDAAGQVRKELPLPASAARFTDVAVDTAGRTWVVDAVEGTLWAAEKGDAAFKKVAGGLKDKLSFPGYLLAFKGKLYLVDQNGNGVVILGQDGAFQGRELSIGWTDGLVYYPGQLCLDGRGDAFLADRQNNRVQVFATTR